MCIQSSPLLLKSAGHGILSLGLCSTQLENSYPRVSPMKDNIQLASLIPDRLPLYDMMRGYFILEKISLKVMPRLGASDFK